VAPRAVSCASIRSSELAECERGGYPRPEARRGHPLGAHTEFGGTGAGRGTLSQVTSRPRGGGSFDPTVAAKTPRLQSDHDRLGVPPQTDKPYDGGFEAAGQHIGLPPDGGPRGMTSPVAFWQVPDIEAKLAEATAAATVKESAHDGGGGRLLATVTDPDGNVFGLLQDR
jgi:hypothetical protein